MPRGPLMGPAVFTRPCPSTRARSSLTETGVYFGCSPGSRTDGRHERDIVRLGVGSQDEQMIIDAVRARVLHAGQEGFFRGGSGIDEFESGSELGRENPFAAVLAEPARQAQK